MPFKKEFRFIIPSEAIGTSVPLYHACLKSEDNSYEVTFQLGRQMASTEYPVDVVERNLEIQKWLEVPEENFEN